MNILITLELTGVFAMDPLDKNQSHSIEKMGNKEVVAPPISPNISNLPSKSGVEKTEKFSKEKKQLIRDAHPTNSSLVAEMLKRLPVKRDREG